VWEGVDWIHLAQDGHQWQAIKRSGISRLAEWLLACQEGLFHVGSELTGTSVSVSGVECEDSLCH
jgi:hypothetical protein